MSDLKDGEAGEKGRAGDPCVPGELGQAAADGEQKAGRGVAATPESTAEKTPRFERASAFGMMLAGVKTGDDVYVWEHGMAVEPWPEPVNGKELLDALEKVITRFAVLPKWASVALALWVLHTYAWLLHRMAVYIGLESPEKRCGKTTVLSVLSELVNRPVVSSNISSPAFFRVIEEKKPTLLIDEADTVLHRRKELNGILNAGCARKTGFVIRMMPRRAQKIDHENGGSAGGESGNGAAGPAGNGKGNEWAHDTGLELGRFSSFCPKAIAIIKHLPEILADRCVLIRMQRKSWQDRCERLRELDGHELRRKCARFVQDHAEEIASARPGLPDDLNDRAADVWEPLLALADLAGGDWPEKARAAALGLTAVAQEESPIGTLLLDIMVAFVKQKSAPENEWMKARGGTRMFSRDIVAELNGYRDRPWMVMRRGKEVTERWLSQQLSPYGVQPRTIWIGDRSAKGYMEEDLTEIFRRYIPRTVAKAFCEELRAAPPEKAPEQPKPAPAPAVEDPNEKRSAELERSLRVLTQQLALLRQQAMKRRAGEKE